MGGGGGLLVKSSCIRTPNATHSLSLPPGHSVALHSSQVSFEEVQDSGSNNMAIELITITRENVAQSEQPKQIEVNVITVI